MLLFEAHFDGFALKRQAHNLGLFFDAGEVLKNDLESVEHGHGGLEGGGVSGTDGGVVRGA
jgi:hypothetical protein